MERKPEPTPIGPEVDYVVKRTGALHEHADTVIEIRERHKRCRLEMIAHEVRVNLFDGFSPRLAEMAAKANLALRLQSLDGELEAEVLRLDEEVRRMVDRLSDEIP